MRYLRNYPFPLRMIAWALRTSIATLSDWDKLFDSNLVPYRRPEKRGKSGKVPIDTVRAVVNKAKEVKSKGCRIRIKQFCRTLKEDLEIDLSRKTIQEILVANDLYAPATRIRRPHFYGSICRRIPNGLLSLDGSEFVVTVDGQPYTFNLELGVDVGSFCHTGFDISKTETAQAIIAVLEKHRRSYGLPLGVLFDHGSANLSDEVTGWLKRHGVEQVPVGPGNPKGNGTDEGAFSQLKKMIGALEINTSSPEQLAKDILNMLVLLYIKMRNKLPLRRSSITPEMVMEKGAGDKKRQHEKDRILAHKASKIVSGEEQEKLDCLYAVIKQHDLLLDDASMKRAEFTIKRYSLHAVHKTERAFVEAVNRKEGRKKIAYFFGILKNLQQQEDDQKYKDYCRKKFEYLGMLNDVRQDQEIQSSKPSIVLVVEMALTAIGQSRIVQDIALRKCTEWLNTIFDSAKYGTAAKKRIQEQIGKMGNLSLSQKEAAWEWIAPLLKVNSGRKSVTSIS